MEDVVHLPHQEAGAPPEAFEAEEAAVEEQGGHPRVEGTWMMVAIPWILIWALPEGHFQWSEDRHHAVGVHLPKGLLPQDQFAAAVEWEEELLCPEEETAMGVPLGENPSLPAEMCICRQGMMATRRKTAVISVATPAEITQAPGTPGTTRRRHGTTPTGTMGTQVPVTTIRPEAIAIEMGTVETETIRTIQVAAHIETPMTVMVTLVVLHPREGPRHHMVEAVAMMITAAHGTDMVEAETVTQAAEAISTQVGAIGLADKTEGCPLPWKGGTLHHAIPTAVQAAEPQEVVAVEEADLIEGVAEADIKKKATNQTKPNKHTKQNFGPKSLFKETKQTPHTHKKVESIITIPRTTYSKGKVVWPFFFRKKISC